MNSADEFYDTGNSLQIGTFYDNFCKQGWLYAFV